MRISKHPAVRHALLTIVGFLCVFGVIASEAVAVTALRVDFETENAVAVTHGQAISEELYFVDGTTQIPEAAGGGTARNLGDETVSWYAAYADGSVPAMSAEMAASGAAGDFALFAGTNNWRITSQVPSNAGGSHDTLTMEGFFNNQEDLVTALGANGEDPAQYDLLKRTFVQQKRSDSAYTESRLWVGMGVKSDPDPFGEDDKPVLAMLCTTLDPESGSRSFTSVLGDMAIAEGDWRHFALVLDTYDVEGTPTSDLTVYLDGQEEISVAGLTDLYPAGSKSFGLGEASAASQRSFLGYLDAVRISDTALTPEEFLISSNSPTDLPGDADRNGVVNEADAQILAMYWGLASGATWDNGDFNKDGAVGAADAAILAANWGLGGTEAVGVPEPSMLAGLLALVVAWCWRRR